MSSKSATPFPLGVFVGGLNGSDPASEAAVDAQYARFTQTLGATPAFMDAFVDQSQPISSWASNASWTAWSWRQSNIAQTTVPVIGLPMATSADTGHQDAVFKQFASGKYDSVLRGIVAAWTAEGYSTLYVRPGYEGNGSFVPWYAGSDPTTRADWVKAFQHIADVLHSAPNADVKVVWNPNIQAGNTGDVTGLYPGDKYVDVIAGDIYSPMYPRDLYDWALNNGTVDSSFAQWAANPINRIHYWTYPAANQWNPVSDGQSNTFSLQNMIDFAKAHGKPIGIAETGAGGDGTLGPTDDPAFPQWLATTLANAGTPVAFVNIWDTNPGDGNWDFSSPSNPKPLESAAWAQYFGAGATTTVGSGPDQITLGLSEDAYAGDAAFTVSVDGVQVGGTLTATANHSGGQSQAFAIDGTFGAGPHSVAVTFVNDAYGGSPSADRNLYLDSVGYNGTTTQVNAPLYSNGTQTETVGASTGPDTLTLALSEDAYQGDAQFSVSLDGVQVGGPASVTAIHGTSSQLFNYSGNFGAGPHTVAVSFLNDAWGGTSATDRNLYVDNVAIDGNSAANPTAALYSNGTADITVAPVTTALTAQDSITFSLSEDAWNGDAAFYLTLDGHQLGGLQTVTASHALGQSQDLTFTGAFGSGQHVASVQFVNDAYGGPTMDRNLYLNGVTFDGQSVPNAAAPLYWNQTASVGFAGGVPLTHG